jgi:hypothetical protein
VTAGADAASFPEAALEAIAAPGVTAAPAPLQVAILADDLIWSGRLADIVRRGGAEPVPVRSAAGLPDALQVVRACVVDLTSRAYDGIAALRAASLGGVPAVAVGQHDDAALRRDARAAGATHVYAYRALFEHGDRDLGGWIAGLMRGTEETP